MSKLIGKKVKVVGSAQFLTPCKGFKGTVLRIAEGTLFSVIVDFGGVIAAYNSDELRYMNNRRVVV